MIRDPQNLSPADPTYRDPQIDPIAHLRYGGSEGMTATTVAAVVFGVLLLLAAAMWMFSPEGTLTATNPPPSTTGQGAPSQMKPSAKMAPAPTDESPAMKK